MGVTDASQIGPGLAGFLTMFFLALAVIVLVRSMVGHLRKVRYSPDPAAEPPVDLTNDRTTDRTVDLTTDRTVDVKNEARTEDGDAGPSPS